MNVAVPPMPKSNRISPSGMVAEASLMNMSSKVKAAIARIMKRLPRVLSKGISLIGGGAVMLP